MWGRILRVFSLFVLAVLFSLSVMASKADAAANSSQSIGVSPALIFAKINAGASSSGAIEISNAGSTIKTVNLSVKQFGVNAYSYSYNFQNTKKNWISLNQNSVSVGAHQTVDVKYSVNVPRGNAPGGNYFTIIASSNFNTGDISSVGQAASLLYVTVNGKLDYSSRILNNSVSHFVFGPSVNYRFTILATGNVYQYVNVFGQLHGLSGGSPSIPDTHIIYPGAARVVSGSINHPLLPGLYKVTYGYSLNSSQNESKSSWVLYIPPWFIALMLIILIILLSYRSKRKNNGSKDKTIDSKERQ
jgi:hypothetical protein